MEKKISIKFIQKEQKFIVYKEENLLGLFTMLGIIKYITSDISTKFLESVEYNQNKEFIEKYFCKKSDDGKIALSGYLDSPIMGNIEVVMKIYAELIKIENNLIQYEINKLENIEERKNITARIKDLFYLILNHSLKLITNISDVIKNDKEKGELKITLIKYSIFITNKINDLLCEKINDCKDEYNLLELEIDHIKKTKSYTEKKINSFEKIISIQKSQIDKIIEYIEIDDMDDIMNMEDKNTFSEKDEEIYDFNESDNDFSENDGKNIDINYLTPKENM